MKNRFILLLLMMTFNLGAFADTSAINAVQTLQHEWAAIKYKIANKQQRIKKYQALDNKAQQLAQASPNSAEIKIWQAIILSTQAGDQGGFGALGLVKKARSLLQQANKIKPGALNGSAYTSLGTLYSQVPPWPIAFGNDAKAATYFKQALKINPRGIDPNFFYADFLLRQGKPAEAIKFLNMALSAPSRPGRQLADAGRRSEIQQLLKKSRAQLK